MTLLCILNYIYKDYGKVLFQSARKLFTVNANLVKQRCHLHFNHRCKDLNVLPPSLRVKPEVNSVNGHALARQYGQNMLRLRITENHQRIRKFERDLMPLENTIRNTCGERLWRRLQRELVGYLGDLKATTIEKHQTKLKNWHKVISNEARYVNRESKWLVNLYTKSFTSYR